MNYFLSSTHGEVLVVFSTKTVDRGYWDYGSRGWRYDRKKPPKPAGRWAFAQFDWAGLLFATKYDPVLRERQTWAHLPYWMGVLLFSVLPVWYFSTVDRRRLRLARGRCAKCGYDLRGSPDRCPECGAPSPASGAADVKARGVIMKCGVLS